MSATGEFYQRSCELAGLDPADLASIDKVATAMETAAEHTNHPFILTDTREQLLERVVAILKAGASC